MATMRTFRSAFGSGIKCVQFQMNSSTLGKSVNAARCILVRHGSYISSPQVGDESQFRKFEISRNPKEWEFVERLLPKAVIPEPTPKPEFPSGWRPQQPQPADTPYYVRRTRNHMQPLYLVRREKRQNRKVTELRFVEGDIWQLERDLKAYIESRLPSKKIIITQVNEYTSQVWVHGDYFSLVKEFLDLKGL